MIPTEHEGTVAVDAAARAFFDRNMRLYPEDERGTWDGLDPLQQNQYRESVLPIVWAALEVIPDRRHTAWAAGLNAGLNAGLPVQPGDAYRIPDNPFPSDPAWRPRVPNHVEEDWLVRNTDWTPDDDPDEYLHSPKDRP